MDNRIAIGEIEKIMGTSLNSEAKLQAIEDVIAKRALWRKPLCVVQNCMVHDAQGEEDDKD